jgi:hypothetical protein
MDPRADFEYILRVFGHDVYLQRRLDDESAIGQYRQVRWSDRLEKHTIREMNSSSMNMAGLVQERAEGVETEYDRVYWFKWDVNPDQGDRIYDGIPETYIDNAGQKNVRINGQTYTIDLAYPFRGEGGRVEYWACGVSKEED